MSELTDLISQIGPKQPQTPYLSNLTGDWISEKETSDPNYWARHTRGTVRFHDNLSRLLENPDHVFLELGPGDTLGRLLRRHPTVDKRAAPIALFCPKQGNLPFWQTLGQLWAAGVQPDWEGFYQNRPRRIPLPTYAFQRRTYWVHPAQTEAAVALKDKPERSENSERLEAPSQHHPRPELDLPYCLPEGQMEELITSVWEAALGIDGIGARDNFFDLGGDSLAAAKTADLLKRKLDIGIPTSSLYTGVTVQTLAEIIEDFTRYEPDLQTGKDDVRQERNARRQLTQNAQRNRRRQRTTEAS